MVIQSNRIWPQDDSPLLQQFSSSVAEEYNILEDESVFTIWMTLHINQIYLESTEEVFAQDWIGNNSLLWFVVLQISHRDRQLST